MIEEESLWIHSHLTGDGFLSFFGNERMNKFDQKDIVNVVTMLHVNKFEVCKFVKICFAIYYACSSDLVFVACQIPFIAMYRKESCPTLLKSLDSDEGNEDNKDNKSDAHKMKWHKVIN